MTKFGSTFLAVGATLCLATTVCMADGQEKTVAFHTTISFEGAQRYITPTSGGGLNASSKVITPRQVFTLVDLGGGELADGDAIQVKYASDEGQTIYWHESETLIKRVRKLDDTCTFKIKFQEKADGAAPTTVTLQTASGKFVTTTDRTSLLSATGAQEKALVLEIVENPVVKTTP
jgi:hypothetical protein